MLQEANTLSFYLFHKEYQELKDYLEKKFWDYTEEE